MAEKSVKGSCLCGEVRYQVTGELMIFQYCHCSRCRKFTGSAHASNIFVQPQQFKWLSGEDNVVSYYLPESKYFGTAFCRTCGSSLPWLPKQGKVMVITAGTLDAAPDKLPMQNIFWHERPDWLPESHELPKFDKLPPKKNA